MTPLDSTSRMRGRGQGKTRVEDKIKGENDKGGQKATRAKGCVHLHHTACHRRAADRALEQQKENVVIKNCNERFGERFALSSANEPSIQMDLAAELESGQRHFSSIKTHDK